MFLGHQPKKEEIYLHSSRQIYDLFDSNTGIKSLPFRDQPLLTDSDKNLNVTAGTLT